MKRARISRLLAAVAAAGAAAAVIAAEPVLRQDQQVQAANIQFWVTSGGDGWECSGCCSTGYCCSVPIDDCRKRPL